MAKATAKPSAKLLQIAKKALPKSSDQRTQQEKKAVKQTKAYRASHPSGSGKRGAPAQQLSGTDMPSSGIGAIRSYDQLRQQAAGQVATEISGEVAPYQTELGQAQADMGQATGTINKMFGTILPFAAQGAQAVQAGYQQSQAAQTDILNQASTRLADLRGQQLQEGQDLAAQVHGPVDLTAFTQPVDITQQMFNQQAAGDLLNSVANAQAGAQEANAFATQVLPLVQNEEISQITTDYNQQIKGIRDEIARIKATQTGRTNTRTNELLTSEREYMLQKTQAERDWKVAQQSLKNEQIRLQLEQASLYGVDKNGNLTLDAKKLGQANKNQDKLNQNQLMQQAGALIDQITQGKTENVTTTQLVPASKNDPDAFPDPQHPGLGSDGLPLHPVKYMDVKGQQTTPGETSLDNIYDYMILNGIPPKTALKAMRTYTGNPKWKYHQNKASQSAASAAANVASDVTSAIGKLF